MLPPFRSAGEAEIAMAKRRTTRAKRIRAPAVKGVLETSLYVEDLDRSERFYQMIFGFETIDRDPGRLNALSVGGRQVLLLFKKGASADAEVPTDGSGELHLTFAIPAQELEAWEKWLAQNGIPIEQKRGWDRGGQSLYFRDPDRHLLELATPGVWSIY